MPQQKDSPAIPILSRINAIPRIATYLFNIYYNIVLPSTSRLRTGLLPVGLNNFIAYETRRFNATFTRDSQ